MSECKVCNNEKVKVGRILTTVTGKPKYVYMDENGRQWAGRRCPDCNNAKARAMEKKAIVERLCSECGVTFSTNKDLQVVCSLECREIRRTKQAREKRHENRNGDDSE